MMPLIAAPLLLAAYYAALIAAKRGTPKTRSLVVRYDPPDDLTPAAARYVWKGSVDQRTIACVFAGLATKGRIALQRNHSSYLITKSPAPASAPALNAEEQSTMEWLFSNFLDHATFSPQSANGCISSLRARLDRTLRGEYQAARSGWAVLGMAASFAMAMLLAWGNNDRSGNIPKFTAMLFMVSFMTAIIASALLIPAVIDLMRGMGSVGRLVFALAFTAFSLSGVAGLSVQLVHFAPVALVVTVIALVTINIVAVPLLRRVTPKGVAAQQQIEGFREYLLKVEQDPLDRLLRPNSLPPPSASLLSYAIALEVKEAWGDEVVNACYVG